MLTNKGSAKPEDCTVKSACDISIILSHGRKVCHKRLVHLLLFLLKIVVLMLIFSLGYF